MSLLAKINWRNPFNPLALFIALALVFFGALQLLQHFHKDPKPEVSVSLTPAQAAEIREPLKDFFQQLYDSAKVVRRQELREALAADRKADSAYFYFQSQQSLRDEKYNAALSASDAELMRQWSDRYDR